MENRSATELLIQAEKLGRFVEYKWVDCKSLPFSGKWIARATQDSSAKSISHTSDSPEVALQSVYNQLKKMAADKIVSMTKQLEEAQEIVRFG
jgi:hypothetical protein